MSQSLPGHALGGRGACPHEASPACTNPFVVNRYRQNSGAGSTRTNRTHLYYFAIAKTQVQEGIRKTIEYFKNEMEKGHLNSKAFEGNPEYLIRHVGLISRRYTGRRLKDRCWFQSSILYC
jgi:hypothetical protein